MNEENNVVNDAMISVSSDSSKTLRKLLAAGLFGPGISAGDAAILADRGVFEAQTAYEVGKGTISEQDAVENLIDRGAAQVSVWFQENGEQLCEQGGLWVGTTVGTWLSAWCPAALPICQQIGQTCGKALGKFGKAFIDDGLRKVASYAKNVWQDIKASAGSIIEKVTDFFA